MKQGAFLLPVEQLIVIEPRFSAKHHGFVEPDNRDEKKGGTISMIPPSSSDVCLSVNPNLIGWEVVCFCVSVMDIEA